MMAICQLHSMQLQKEAKSNPAVKKYAKLKMAIVKNWNPRWRSRNSCDGRNNVKNFNNNNSGEFGAKS